MTQPRPADQPGELAAMPTPRLLLVAAELAAIEGVLFAAIAFVFFDWVDGLGDAAVIGALFGAAMFVVHAATSWSRRAKARRGRHWLHDD